MFESSSGSGFTYRAFISYSHRDKAWGDWLHKALETYRVPPRLVGTQTAHGTIPGRLTPIFRDREELPSASDLGRAVSEALTQSENLIVICSPSAAASRWINEEVLAWKRMGRAERIFCLIVDGEPNATDLPGRAAEECFCPALRFKLDADGHPTGERTESIAADARPGKDGKANAKLKLVAGMLGLGFDALKQREQHRRMQRMAVITVLALVVMAATSLLAVYALVSRHAAVTAQAAAERRQKHAEDLVGFMLGDLNDKLQASGRLDVMQAVNDKALAYFRSLPDTDVSATALQQRAKALEKIGDIRMSQGQSTGALDAFGASTRISSRLAAAEPTDIARQIAYSRTLAYIGFAHWNQGRLDAAQQAFEAARKPLRSVQSRTKENPALLAQQATLANNIGHVHEARGQLDEAEAEYQRNLSLARELAALDPADASHAAELGAAHNNVGKLALQRGDLATAVAEYRADDAIETRLSARDSRDNTQRQMMLRARAILGRTLVMTGDIEAGTRDLQQAVDIAGELMMFDPDQTDYQDDAALYSTQLARLKRLGGDGVAAKALTVRSIAILSTLTRKDPSNTYWQGDLAGALTEQAAQSHATGRMDDARKQVQAALRILEPMLAKAPDDRDTLLATMTAKLLLAEVAADPSAAQSVREGALKTMRRQATGRNDPRLLALQVDALMALGRNADAQPLVRQLWQSGYRDPTLLDVLSHALIDYPPNPDFQARLEVADAEAAHDRNPPPAGNEARE